MQKRICISAYLALVAGVLCGCRGNTSDSAFPPLWKLGWYAIEAPFVHHDEGTTTTNNLIKLSSTNSMVSPKNR